MISPQFKVLVVACVATTVLSAASTRPAQAQVIEFCEANPGTCATIAREIWNYLQANSTTVKCAKLTASCARVDRGGINMCNRVNMKVRHFVETPDDYHAKEVMRNTGSDRSTCVARKLMGCKAWTDFLDSRNVSAKSFRRKGC
jgi:hypothetical protein